MLKQRIITAAVALLVVLLALMFGGAWTWRILVWIGCVVGGYEFAAMLGCRWNSLLSWWGYIVISIIQWYPKWHSSIVIEVLVALTLVMPVASRNRISVTHAGAVLLGAMYIGYGGKALVMTREFSNGLVWIFMVLLATWATDTLAFFVGRAVKGPKLWPSISPQKTVSGAFGGVFGGMLGAIIVPFVTHAHIDIGFAAGLGAVVSVCAQLGDFVESAYKRSAGVKDSGNLLPGHGGVLDRVDGLIFAAPFAFAMISSYLTGTFS